MDDKIYDLGLYDYNYTTNPIGSSDQEGKMRRRKKYLLDFLDADEAKKGNPKRLSHPPSDEEDEEKIELKGQEEKVKNLVLMNEGAQCTEKDITVGEIMLIDHENAHNSNFVAPIEKDKGSKDHHHHDDEASFELPQDIFSIMFVSPIFSTGFLYGVFVYTLQISILMLALYGLLNEGHPDNQFNIPLYVNLNVIIAQICAMFVIVFSADDVVKSFDIFQIQYDANVKAIYPSATLFKLYLTNLLRVCEGYLVVFVTYLFVLQSYNVMELFLDFAAVQFVGELDEIGFYLAKKGEHRIVCFHIR